MAMGAERWTEIPLKATVRASASNTNEVAGPLRRSSRLRVVHSALSRLAAAQSSTRAYSVPKRMTRSSRLVVACAATANQLVTSRPKPTASIMAAPQFAALRWLIQGIWRALELTQATDLGQRRKYELGSES